MAKTITYKTSGTCSSSMTISIDESTGKILDFSVVGGCPGNLGGIKQLIIGMDAKIVSEKLAGVTCRTKATSCPDQLSRAIAECLKEIVDENN